MSVTDTANQKKMYGLGNKTLIISNNDIKDLNKIITTLEENDILLKGVGITLKNDIKIKKEDF